MSDFARQQAEFQRGILDGDDTVLAEILDSPREKRETLFGVYRYAYGSRLVEAMRNDHALLHLYLGDETFDEMGHAYVKARPSGHPNLRWFSQGLPEFLKSTAPYAEHPELSDLAALEKALNDAFDAAEGKVVELTDMAGFAPEHVDSSDSVRSSSCDLANDNAALLAALKTTSAPARPGWSHPRSPDLIRTSRRCSANFVGEAMMCTTRNAFRSACSAKC